jgi:hypothetical protein
VQKLKPVIFSGFAAQSKMTRSPRKNRTAAAKAGHFNKLCGTGKPVPFVGSGSPIQLLGAGPHPVFISLGVPKAHGDTTEQFAEKSYFLRIQAAAGAKAHRFSTFSARLNRLLKKSIFS